MSDGRVVFDITGDTSGINKSLDDATSAIAKKTAKWTALANKAVDVMGSAVKGGFKFAADLAKNSFEYNAKMETYEVNFRTMLGSAEAAQKKIAELREYAAKTPFTMDDLAGATQTLLSFGISSEDASVALKYLGDISLGDANNLNSLTLAFAQVSSAGKLAGQDLQQMIDAGFNPLQVIAEKTGASYADLKAVMSGEKTSDDFALRLEAARKEVEELGVNASESAILLTKIGDDGMISAELVAAAMRIATSEGGRFHNALLNASQTAKGQMSTISDQWDTLIGKVGGGVFDALSQKAFPKVIEWLDELNKAYDENGFEGLKGAAGGIFDEIGAMAFNIGAGLITNLYNGITGSSATTEDIKEYLKEIFGAASDVVANIKDAGVDFLAWVEDHGEAVGAAATAIGTGFAIFMAFTHPLAAGLAAVAASLVLFTTDWEKFGEKYPNIVASFKSLTGIDFSTFADSVAGARDSLSSFYNDVLAPFFAFCTENSDAVAAALFAVGFALAWFGAPILGISLMLGVFAAKWKDIKEAMEKAGTAINEFFTITVPESWHNFCDEVSSAWKTNVCDPIDDAATKIADFFGINVPDGWSLCGEIGKAWDALGKQIDGVIEKIYKFLGIKTKKDLIAELPYDVSSWSGTAQDAALAYMEYFPDFMKGDATKYGKLQEALDKITQEQGGKEMAAFMRAVQDYYRNQPDPQVWTGEDGAYGPAAPDGYQPPAIELYAGQSRYISWKYAVLDQPIRAELKKYAEMALKKGITGAMMSMDANTPIPDEVLQSFTADLTKAMEDGELTIENINAWFGDAQGQLQSQLDGTELSVSVNAVINGMEGGADASTGAGLSGESNATGGLFTSATRMLGPDGMHTFGESGTEVLLPMDALWRKMGMILDQGFTENLAGLQYSVLPQLPASTPTPPTDNDMPDKLAKAMREAVSDITIEMDKRTVGRMVAPVVSQEMADDLNGRMWTA